MTKAFASYILIAFCHVSSIVWVLCYATARVWMYLYVIAVRRKGRVEVFEWLMGRFICFVESLIFLLLTKQTSNDSEVSVRQRMESTCCLHGSKVLPLRGAPPNGVLNSSYFAWSGYAGVLKEEAYRWYTMPKKKGSHGNGQQSLKPWIVKPLLLVIPLVALTIWILIAPNRGQVLHW